MSISTAAQDFLKRKKNTLRGILAVCMVVAGILHFAIPEPFIKIVPGLLPYPEALVYISGVFEVLLGAGLLWPPTRQLSAWGLVALFIAVYPANLNMAFNHISVGGIPDA